MCATYLSDGISGVGFLKQQEHVGRKKTLKDEGRVCVSVLGQLLCKCLLSDESFHGSWLC